VSSALETVQHHGRATGRLVATPGNRFPVYPVFIPLRPCAPRNSQAHERPPGRCEARMLWLQATISASTGLEELPAHQREVVCCRVMTGLVEPVRVHEVGFLAQCSRPFVHQVRERFVGARGTQPER
jgi:hypothetical protein